MGGDMTNDRPMVRERLAQWRKEASLKQPRGGAPLFRLLEHEVEGLLDEVERAWAAYTNCQERLFAEAKARDSFASQVEALTEQVRGLEGRLLLASSQNAYDKSERARLEEQIDSIVNGAVERQRQDEGTIATLRESIDALSAERVQMVRAGEGQAKIINAQALEITTLKARNTNQAEQIASLSREVRERESRERKAHAVEVANLREEIARLSQATAAPNPGARTFAHENRLLRERVETLTEALETAKKSNDDLIVQVADLRSERRLADDTIRDLAQQRDTVHEALSAAEEKVRVLTTERDLLRKNLAAQVEAHSQAAEQIAWLKSRDWRDLIPSGVSAIIGHEVIGEVKPKYPSSFMRDCTFFGHPKIEMPKGLAAGGLVGSSVPIIATGGCDYVAPSLAKASGRRGGKSKARNETIAAWVEAWLESGSPGLVLNNIEGVVTASLREDY